MSESEHVLRSESLEHSDTGNKGDMLLFMANISSPRILHERLGVPPTPCCSSSPGKGSPGSHLHNTIPVVTSGDSEEGQKGHTKVPKGGMSAQALTRVCLITL